MKSSVFPTRSYRRKHVWDHFCLSYGKEKLLDDDARLHDFGIRKNDEVSISGDHQ